MWYPVFHLKVNNQVNYEHNQNVEEKEESDVPTKFHEGHLSTFVELELAFEARIVNLSIFDNDESQFESLTLREETKSATKGAVGESLSSSAKQKRYCPKLQTLMMLNAKAKGDGRDRLATRQVVW
ncbi:hypothetical protein H5410_016222 [Solanum commersonii]|uniref:Uncharacterized protein n=1 Tax=Solanum commersonii TaxID=4109 RepID=A0A9J5ZVT7_SOLCO|nr:hypothetical protein H5410_016222 [Solanum commersonii]